MEIFTTLLYALIFCILTVLSYIFVTSLVNYINQLTITSHARQKLYETCIIKNATTESKDQLSNANELLNLIDELIHNEINLIMYRSAGLYKKYDIKYLDTDSSTIASNVCEALKKDFITKKDLPFDPTYIYNYITKNASFKLLATVKEYNSKINDSGI